MSNLTCVKRPVKGNQLHKVNNYTVVYPLVCTLAPEDTIFPVMLCSFIFPRMRPSLRNWHFKPSVRLIEIPCRDPISMDRF